MYLTSSLKISTKHLKNNYAMGCVTFQEERKTVGWLVVSDREAMGTLGVNGF